jgi:hypothetical protein
MKIYLLIISFAALSFSCNQDEPQSNEPQSNNPDETDCECDRVVEVNTFQVVGTPENPALNYYSVYTTINDCTQIQRQKNFTTTDPSMSPLLGQCR